MIAPEEKHPKRKSRFLWGLGWLLKGMLALALLGVLLILLSNAYEDWSGARAWVKAKAQIEAAGISLDPDTYIPPTVPETENFAALPIFQLEPDPKHNGARKLLALDKAIAPIYENTYYPNVQTYKPGMLPYLGKWERGEEPDMVLVKKQLTDFCLHASPAIQPPADATPSELLSLICPALADLRVANLSHPSCRFNRDFARMTPEIVEPITDQLSLAKVLSYEEQLAVLSDQPQLALDDFKVDWKITSGLQKEPLLIDGLVTATVVVMHLRVINEGLALDVWNDQQVKDLAFDLGRIDFLTESPLCLRGDLAVCEIPLIARCKTDRSSLMRDAEKASNDYYGQPLDHGTYWRLWIKIWLTPNGSYDRYLASFAPLILPGNTQTLDIASRRVFPDKEAIDSQVSNVAHNWYGNLKQLAYAQVQIDETRIGCFLERYRLSHGNYPDSLDALVPAYSDDLPRDIMNGESYHYKLMGDGKYMIYSVGWN